MIGLHLLQGLRLETGLRGIGAALGKAAARLRIDGRGDFALEQDPLHRVVNISGRNG